MGLPQTQIVTAKNADVQRYAGFSVEAVLARHSARSPEFAQATTQAWAQMQQATGTEFSPEDQARRRAEFGRRGSTDPRLEDEGTLAYLVRFDSGYTMVVLDNKTVQAEVEGARARFGRGVGDHYRIEKTGEPWNPDLGMLARAMRADVLRVEKPGEFAPALRAALGSGKLSVLDVECATDVPRYAVPLIRTLGTMPFPYTWAQEV